jgi:DNA-binding protein WhiA
VSFSSEVKKELSSLPPGGRHCDIAELAGIINTCGSFTDTTLKIQTENPVVAKKCFALLKRTFNIISEVSMGAQTLKRAKIYSVYTEDAPQINKVLRATGMLSTKPEPWKHLNLMVVRSDCCKRAYVRGAFLSGGSVSDPEKSYHMEFVNTKQSLARSLMTLLNDMELNAKMIQRKSYFVVYLKEGANIVDLLNIMGAHKSLLDLENLRVLKDMRGSVNRIVNCETANINKVVAAAVAQIEDINYIERTRGLSSLPEQLEDVARARLANPEASLIELAAMLGSNVGKSGVNHRLRKLSEIAGNLRNSEGRHHYD